MSSEVPNEVDRGLVPEVDHNSSTSIGKSWFLGIGINTYKSPFSSLNNARKDTADILALLKERYELDEWITLYDEEATREAIIGQFQFLDKSMGKDDKLIIYYAGHGYLDEKNNRGYWLPADVKKDNLATYIRNTTIREFIADFDAKHALLISDSCFSGALLYRDTATSQVALKELEKDRSRWVISSGRQQEKVSDGPQGKNSPFADSILRVLGDNQDARLNTGLIYDKVMKLTRFNYKQLPQSAPLFEAGHEGGQYVFRLLTKEEIGGEDEKLKSVEDRIKELSQDVSKNLPGETQKLIEMIGDNVVFKKAMEKYTSGARSLMDQEELERLNPSTTPPKSSNSQFYSCFISSSRKDEDFVLKLYDKLVEKGVNVWLDQKDIKIGDKIRKTIYKAIEDNHKLLIILSENSIESPWVEDEVETAFEKERMDKSLVLFPIRLDGTIFNTKEAWASYIRRQRYIGDFSNWRDEEGFKIAFERLLRDLRKEND